MNKTQFMQLKVTFLLLLISTLGFAQNTITGEVYENNKPSTFIEVVLFDATSKPLTSTFTDDKGKFSLPTQKGNYRVEGRLLGKILFTKEVKVDKNVDLGRIEINSTNTLNEVVVISKKKMLEKKIDRMVFNPEFSLLSSGSNAFDILRTTPMVTINNDNISIINKSGVRVMIDGKMLQLEGEALKSFLNTIPSENIKAIEIITTPPARYDAEGNAGILNYVLKKPLLEYALLNYRTGYQQATYASWSQGINMMYKKNKWSTLIDVGYNHRKNIYTNDQLFEYVNKDQVVNTINKDNLTKSITGLFNVNYQWTKNKTIGSQIYLGKNNYNSTQNNTSLVKNNNLLIDEFLLNDQTTSPSKTISANINYEHKLDTIGKTLSIDFDYFNNNATKDNSIFSDRFSGNGNLLTSKNFELDNTRDYKNYSFMANMDYPLEKYILNFGVKSSYSIYDNVQKGDFYQLNNFGFQPYLTQNNDYQYDENINALYIDFQKKINEKWTIKAGLRNEYIRYITNDITNQEKNENQYNKIFPTIYISYNRNDNHNFSLNYSKRISRPRFNDLNPAIWYLNENLTERGNPFLQPSFSNNIEFTHLYKSKLNTNFSVSISDQNYGQLTNQISPYNQQMKRQNYYDYFQISLYQYYTFNIGKKIESSVNYSVSYNKTNTDTTLLTPSFEGYIANIQSVTTMYFKSNKSFLGQLILVYTMPSQQGENKNTHYGNVTYYMQYTKSKFVFTLGFQDIFRTNFYTISSISNNVNQSFRQYYDSQKIIFNFNYKIGNQKTRHNKRKTSNKEETDRAE